MVKAAITRGGARELGAVAEMREGLENRMVFAAARAASFAEFVDACTSRRYPAGRIQRHCVHLLLGLTHAESRAFQAGGPAYIRVLGANGRGRELLRAMRKTAALPVTAKPSAPWSGYASGMMNYEHRATELWELLTEKPRLRAEARYVPILTE
jgi:predicted nucleotidyltransferase